MLRGDKKPCPFGLKIPSDCETIGTKVLTMQPNEPSSNEMKEQARVNQLPGCNFCIYAKTIFAEKKAVDCAFNDVPQDVTVGTGNFYPHIFIGTQTQPTSMNYSSSFHSDSAYHDNNLDTQMFPGAISFYGNH